MYNYYSSPETVILPRETLTLPPQTLTIPVETTTLPASTLSPQNQPPSYPPRPSQSFTITETQTSIQIQTTVLSSPSPAANILQNPGFESGMTRWSYYGSPNFNAPITVGPTSSQFHSGSHSFIFQAPSIKDKSEIVQTIIVTPGIAYAFSFWYRISANPSSSIVCTADGQQIARMVTGGMTVNTWFQTSGTFTPCNPSILIVCDFIGSAMMFYFDDVVVAC